MRSNNPVLKDDYLKRGLDLSDGSKHMTLQGAINKSAILVAITMGVGMYVYYTFMNSITTAPLGLLSIGGGIVGFILALIISFKPTTAPLLAPIYATAKGVLVGSVSLMYSMAFNGLVQQALLFTFMTLFGMLFLYKCRIIQASQRMGSILKTGLFVLIGVYAIAWLMSLFGSTGFSQMIYGGGPISIGISAVAVLIAAFFLIMDFDLIENGAANEAPKYMEWYCGFALLVTLVWLYLEILRLLSYLQSSD